MLFTVVPPICYAQLVQYLSQCSPGTLTKLRKWRSTHNVCIAIYSAYAAFSCLYKLLRANRFQSIHALCCVSGPGSPLFWYTSKIWEWADTVFIFAGGRFPSRLHLFHHGVTASLVALNFTDESNVTPLYDLAVFLNGLVHTVMYGYYIDPTMFRRIRRLVTLTQILQHMIILTALVYALFDDTCPFPKDIYLPSLCSYVVFLVLFLHLYSLG